MIGECEIPQPRVTKSESAGHVALKRQLRTIMAKCSFIVDTEVHVNLTGNRDEAGNLEDDRSFDVVAKFSHKGRSCLLLFECKDSPNIENAKQTLSGWQYDIRGIQNSRKNVAVTRADDKKITSSDFERVNDVRLCFVFSEKLTHQKFEEYQKLMKDYSFFLWNSQILKYYHRTSDVLAEWTKYEVFREFNLFFEPKDLHSEPSVKVGQPGCPEFYLVGMHPGLLLKIGYVYRRTSKKPDAYQRILSKQRLEQIAKFLGSTSVLLPNAIIIVFDDDKRIQEKVNWEEGKLEFPIAYSSAWIIDGQHRLFGFMKTKFCDWSPDVNEEFKLPVVAFKTLDSVFQNRTFVNINYFQKKIDPTLLCDLAAATRDMKNELTWPSLLVRELANHAPFDRKVKISEFDAGRPISLSGFARYGLLEGLLGYSSRTKDYKGVLFRYAPFNSDQEFGSSANQQAFELQFNLLLRFFKAVHSNTYRRNDTKDPWRNFRRYSLLRTTGVNALLLVLARIIAKHPKAELDFKTYLNPIKKANFKREFVAKQGGGWVGFRNLANEILRKLEQGNADSLTLFGGKEKM